MGRCLVFVRLCACSEVLHWLRLRGSHSSTESEKFPLTDWKMRTPFRHQECDHRHSARGTTPASPRTGAGCSRDKPKSRHMTGHTETSHRAPKYRSGRRCRQCPAFLSGEFACTMLVLHCKTHTQIWLEFKGCTKMLRTPLFDMNFCRCRTFNPHCRGFLREDYVGLGGKWRIFTGTSVEANSFEDDGSEMLGQNSSMDYPPLQCTVVRARFVCSLTWMVS